MAGEVKKRHKEIESAEKIYGKTHILHAHYPFKEGTTKDKKGKDVDRSSGVTIGYGIDLGKKDLATWTALVKSLNISTEAQTNLIDTFKGALGLQGAAAVKWIEAQGFELKNGVPRTKATLITQPVADALFEKAWENYEIQAKEDYNAKYPTKEKQTEWDKIPSEVQDLLTSNAYLWGHLKLHKNLLKAVHDEDITAIKKWLPIEKLYHKREESLASKIPDDIYKAKVPSTLTIPPDTSAVSTPIDTSASLIDTSMALPAIPTGDTTYVDTTMAPKELTKKEQLLKSSKLPADSLTRDSSTESRLFEYFEGLDVNLKILE